MNALRTGLLLRTTAAIVALFAWVVLSNHCALATLLPAQSSIASSDSGCCKHQTKPVSDNTPCPELPHGCCKSLKIAMPDTAKIPHATMAQLLPVVAELFAVFALPISVEVSVLAIEGPPPDSPTFAELVLNRSLLSHAPPVCA